MLTQWPEQPIGQWHLALHVTSLSVYRCLTGMTGMTGMRQIMHAGPPGALSESGLISLHADHALSFADPSVHDECMMMNGSHLSSRQP